MKRRTLLQLLSAGVCLAILAGLYLAAWTLSWKALNRPRPLQMHTPKGARHAR